MAKKTSPVKLGLFIIIGVSLLVLAIFLVGDKNALFSKTFEVKAYFNDIQGLRSGATVRLSGIDVGSVSNVSIVDDATGRIEVRMNLVEDIKRFIRTDTKATISTEGLVGSKVVVLKIGSTDAAHVGEGGVIQTEDPLGFDAIIAETQGIMEYTKTLTMDLSEIISKVNKGEGTMGKILNDDELYNEAVQLTQRADQSLTSITDELGRVTEIFNRLGEGVEKVVANVDSVVVEVDGIISNLKNGDGVLGALLVNGSKYDTVFTSMMRNIELTSSDARLAASRLAENMEALKHNWLFKSYFEERGYWDKAEYEDAINSRMNELNNKIELLDERIETLKQLEAKK
jgi:phospholipid/cholesterol/gamma-HCH transport system substrate-binding protein